jgi:uncharacterized repeat protein (TIGR03803 family)
MRATAALFLAVITVPIAGCQSGAQRGTSYVPSDVLPVASNETVIHSFTGPPLGEIPEANPIVDAAGRLEGTTMRGGTNGTCGSGCGTIFRLTHTTMGWNETTLSSFDLTHGAYPSYPLVADASGNLFGATDVGGALGVAYGLFAGARGWQLRDLHNFTGDRDGAQPRSSLIFDKHANLYGTTVSGGTGGSGGGGTVYELIPAGNHWTEDVIYRFTPYSNGANPQAPVVFGRDGSLYGTTSYGGNQVCPAGCGVVFRLTPIGPGRWQESVLHAFNGADGYTSVSGLVTDASGNFFGSANLGGKTGCFAGCGVLFELTRGSHHGWTFSVIHYFTVTAGGGPSGNMAFDGAGNLYGTTAIGGNVNACPQQSGCGVVFKLAPGANHLWKYGVLHKFNNTPDGALPTGLIRSASGKLYGTTIGGGSLGLGTVFEVTP